MSTAIIAERAIATVTKVLDEYNNHHCDLCGAKFGEKMDDGNTRDMYAICHFGQQHVREERRETCVACTECVKVEDHIAEKAKCAGCIKKGRTGRGEAALAIVAAMKINCASNMFQTLAESQAEHEVFKAEADAAAQTAAGQGQRQAASEAQDAAAKRRGYQDRADELAQREAKMQEARNHSDFPFTGSSWDAYREWMAMVAVETAKAEAKQAAKEEVAAAKQAAKEQAAAAKQAKEEAAAAKQAAKEEAAKASPHKAPRKQQSDETKAEAAQKKAEKKDAIAGMAACMTRIAFHTDATLPLPFTLKGNGRYTVEKITQPKLYATLPDFLEEVREGTKKRTRTILEMEEYMDKLEGILADEGHVSAETLQEIKRTRPRLQEDDEPDEPDDNATKLRKAQEQIAELEKQAAIANLEAHSSDGEPTD